MLRIALATLLLAASATPALAQKVVRGEDTTVYKKTTRLDVTGVTLDGTPETSDGRYMFVHRRAQFDSLINLRRHFQPEMQKSIEHL